MTRPKYQPLPGRGRNWMGTSRVWLGEDHVLLVQSRGYTESYRRFFFKDIQAIVVQRTHTGKTWNGIWSGLWALFAILAAVVQDSVGAIILLSLGAPFGIAFIVNLILGPMSTCHIRTAVQTERIPALSRLRSTQKFIARIEPFIVAAQGELPPETLSALASPPAASVLEAPPVLGS